MQDFWLVLFKDIFSFIKRNCHKRLICMLGALFIALSQPISLVAAAPHQEPIIPPYMRHVEAAQAIPASNLTEIPLVPAYVPPAPVTGCGSDPLMAYIYRVESGCNTGAYNPGGCRGLGQACPGSKLPCSDSDWACQDAWFRNYAVSAYGSIYGAYIFRTAHNWW